MNRDITSIMSIQKSEVDREDTRKRVITFYFLDRLCRVYNTVSLTPKITHKPALSKHTQCNQYFGWVLPEHYDLLSTAWPNKLIRTLISIEESSAAGNKLGQGYNDIRTILSRYTIIMKEWVEGWTKHYVYWRKEAQGDTPDNVDWEDQKLAGPTGAVSRWCWANIPMIKDSDGILPLVDLVPFIREEEGRIPIVETIWTGHNVLDVKKLNLLTENAFNVIDIDE